MSNLSWLINKRILVTGGTGFLGQHLCRMLRSYGAKVVAPTRNRLNLVEDRFDVWEAVSNCDAVVHLAAEVGGIEYNSKKPFQQLAVNSRINLNVLEAVLHFRKPVVVAGSVCAYPESCPVPFREEDFWNGKPEPTNFAYGESKRHMLALLEAFRQYPQSPSWAYLTCANLYGEGDNFDPRSSHVIPALIRKFYQRKKHGAQLIEVWGDPDATRDFLHVMDAANAYVQALRYVFTYQNAELMCNIGTGVETSILTLVKMLQKLYEIDDSAITYLGDKYVGQKRRKLIIERAKDTLNWNPLVSLEVGLERTVQHYDYIQDCSNYV